MTKISAGKSFFERKKMSKKNGNPVVHFEIGCRDKAKTADFYSEIFGWEVTPAQYNSRVDTNSGTGINGHITSLGHEPHNYVNLYIEVSDIPSTLREIEAQGGTTHIGPLPTGTGQEFAWFKDPEGTMLALITPKKQ